MPPASLLQDPEGARCLRARVHHSQPAFSRSFSWVIGQAANGTRDLQATRRKGNTGMEEKTEFTEACQTFFFFSRPSFPSVQPLYLVVHSLISVLSSNTPRSRHICFNIYLFFFFFFSDFNLEPPPLSLIFLLILIPPLARRARPHISIRPLENARAISWKIIVMDFTQYQSEAKLWASE